MAWNFGPVVLQGRFHGRSTQELSKLVLRQLKETLEFHKIANFAVEIFKGSVGILFLLCGCI